MRSYEAARSLFSFLGFISWCIIILGGIVAIGAMQATSNARGFGGAASSMMVMMSGMPGLAAAFLGFIALAIVQTGRASVDSAEYSQQMLQVARDQLEVSRQALRTGRDGSSTFAASLDSDEEPQSASFADTAPTATKTEAEPPRPAPNIEDGTTYDIRGTAVTKMPDGTFVVSGKSFASLEAVKDHLRSNAHRNSVRYLFQNPQS